MNQLLVVCAGVGGAKNERNLVLFQCGTIFLWYLKGYEIQKLIQEQKSYLGPKHNNFSPKLLYKDKLRKVSFLGCLVSN